MTVLLMALALYGLGTVAYQVAGMAITAVAMIKKMDKAADSLLVPATPITLRKKEAV